MLPENKARLEEYKQIMMPAWRHTLQFHLPQRTPQIELEKLKTNGEFTVSGFKIKPRDSEPIIASYWAPMRFLSFPVPKVVVLVQPKTSESKTNLDATPTGLPLALLHRGVGVIQFDWSPGLEVADQFTNFYTTYNLTRVQQKVRDIANTCAVVQNVDARPHRPFTVVILGTGVGGLWSLLAAPVADAVVADANNLDVSEDRTLLEPDLFTPGLRNLGGYEGAALLAAPHPLLVHHTAKRFATGNARSTYKALGKFNQLAIEAGLLPDDRVAKWISEL
jgi:hypothetical protein